MCVFILLLKMKMKLTKIYKKKTKYIFRRLEKLFFFFFFFTVLVLAYW